ncbi:hypothetical protein TWF730_011049 [Orbilia blumenaviensis]|uniref:Peptidase S8/S53 domain-containing protein n=1 Tax=Orbilia blumenaviensis TaxID=1796055 RepID=A0AAV9UK90_9PEZI
MAEFLSTVPIVDITDMMDPGPGRKYYDGADMSVTHLSKRPKSLLSSERRRLLKRWSLEFDESDTGKQPRRDSNPHIARDLITNDPKLESKVGRRNSGPLAAAKIAKRNGGLIHAGGDELTWEIRLLGVPPDQWNASDTEGSAGRDKKYFWHDSQGARTIVYVLDTGWDYEHPTGMLSASEKGTSGSQDEAIQLSAGA